MSKWKILVQGYGDISFGCSKAFAPNSSYPVCESEDVVCHLPAAKQGNSEASDGGCEGGMEGVKKGRFRRVLDYS